MKSLHSLEYTVHYKAETHKVKKKLNFFHSQPETL
jgi:hypothetical protein